MTSGSVGPENHNSPSPSSDRWRPPRRDDGRAVKARTPREEPYLHPAYSQDSGLPKPQVHNQENRSQPDRSSIDQDVKARMWRRHGHSDRLADRLGNHGKEAAQVLHSGRGRRGSQQTPSNEDVSDLERQPEVRVVEQRSSQLSRPASPPDAASLRDRRRDKHHQSKRDKISERLGPRHAEGERIPASDHRRRGEHKRRRTFSSASSDEEREHVHSRGHLTERERLPVLQGTTGLRSDKLFSRAMTAAVAEGPQAHRRSKS